MKCYHEVVKVVQGNFKSAWCSKNKQWLAGTTCQKCPDYIKERDDIKPNYGEREV